MINPRLRRVDRAYAHLDEAQTSTRSSKPPPRFRAAPHAGRERIQYLFKLKFMLEDHIEMVSATLITLENGKTFAEARAELRRGIENVEVACGIPMMMQGYNLEDITPGVDETLIRQPLGVVAAITPFNFPAMIPFGSAMCRMRQHVVLKPSERVPLSMRRAMDHIQQTGIPRAWSTSSTGASCRRALRPSGHSRCELR